MAVQVRGHYGDKNHMQKHRMLGEGLLERQEANRMPDAVSPVQEPGGEGWLGSFPGYLGNASRDLLPGVTYYPSNGE